MSWLGIVGAAVACLQISGAAAQSFPIPGRPIRIVVPFPPGGTSDIHARPVAAKLSAALGAPVFVENKPGGATIIGAMDVVRAAPDGHTLLYTLSLTVANNPHLFARLPYDVERDFTPVIFAGRGATVLAVSSTVPVNNLRELVAHAKANPGKLNFGSWSPGGSGHLNGELLREFAGIDIVHVPYKGSADLVQALASGSVHLAFDGLITAAGLAKAGKAKIIAVTDERRFAAIPDVPTMAEAGVPGSYATGGYHFLGPAKLPRPVVQRLNAELARVLRLPEINELYVTTGFEVAAGTPEEQAAVIRDHYRRTGVVIRKLGIKLD